MSFAWPHLLWLLAVPGCWLIWELTHRRRAAVAAHPKILRAEAGARSLHLTTTSAPRSSHLRGRFWLCAGLAFAIAALARPQWGRIEEQVFDQSREILLAVDLSRSMLAQDVKPSRLDRAKLLIQALLERLEGERVGLLVFAGTAFLQSPLSADYEILREFLPALGPDYLPQGGSNYAALLEAAASSFGSGSTADRFLIVLSDGEATDAEWKARLDAMKAKGVRAIGLGIGTAAGAMIPDDSGGFVKDERGAVVLSKLEINTLQELASATNGVYRDASTWLDLAELLRETVEAGQKGEFTERNQIRLVERFQWALAPALLCFLLSFWREFPVRPKPRELALKPPADASQPPPMKSTLTAALLCLAFVIAARPATVAATPAANAKDPLVAPLTHVVGRLSTQSTHSAGDWAELARTTITYGQHLQSSQQQAPEGAVRDALAGVELGAAADPKAADWPQLRKDLEALLPKPQEKPPESQQNQQQEQQQQDQNQQQKQDQSPPQNGQPQNSDSEKGEPQNDETDGKPSDEEQPQEQTPPPSESAFGDMKEPGAQESQEPPPPPPSDETQKVGGNPDKAAAPKDLDPALAVPLQKLEQLRNDDSPAKLFQLMDGEKKPDSGKKGKDW